MSILFEHEVNARIDALSQAWRSPHTFALLPDRSSVSLEWVKDSLESLPSDLRSGHFAMLTSGSTGKPKLIIGSRGRAESLTRVLHTRQESEPVGSAILTLPLTYTYSFVNQWLWTHVHGRTLTQTHGLAQPDELGSALETARDAMLCLVGVQVPLFAQYFQGRRFEGVIRVHFAGGRFPQEQLHTVRSLFPNAHIFNNYGCAEAMPRLTIRPAEASGASANIGTPLRGVELRSTDDDALQFRSEYGAVGVIEHGSGLSRIGPETWVPTGDLGRVQPDGSWALLGRASEVFKRYGEKISLPSLLGTALEAWPGQGAFYRETDPRGEEGHVLVLAPTPDDSAVRTVLRALATRHPRTHWPLRIESLERLPTLSNGKVDVAALKQDPNRTSHWRQHI